MANKTNMLDLKRIAVGRYESSLSSLYDMHDSVLFCYFDMVFDDGVDKGTGTDSSITQCR